MRSQNYIENAILAFSTVYNDCKIEILTQSRESFHQQVNTVRC